MGSVRRALILGLILIGLGLGLFAYKVLFLDYPVRANEKTNIWDLEVFVSFIGEDRPARIEAFLPPTDVPRTFPGENFYNGAFGLSIETEGQTQNRRAIWTYRYPGNRKVLRYTARTIGETAATPLSKAFREKAPRPQPYEVDDVRRQAYIVWTGSLRQRSADPISFINLALAEVFARQETNPLYRDELDVLLADGGALQRLRLAVDVLEAEGHPARIVNGVFLTEDRRYVELRRWLEYHVDGEDFRYFPGGTPRRFFTLFYGDEDLVSSTGVDSLAVQLSLRRAQRATLGIVERLNSPLGGLERLFTFRELPLTTQLVYEVLVTIPVGITILVFLRQFIGVTTLGTFMPVLIGIAFRETTLINGVLLFSVLIGMGLGLRFLLERLQLLLVPRLAVMVIFIVIAMAGLTIALTNTNQAIGLSLSLFPIVIITMTIERMSIVWEESSAGEAVKQGCGSLLVAAITFLAMSNDRVEYLMYQFPELLAALMGLNILMGRYTGLRLTEFWRFRTLAR